jgi:lipopolysaccharide biosynthesis glycosyltransferase
MKGPKPCTEKERGKMTKAAVYTGTQNLYGGMIAASKSLIANSDVDEVWLLIEDDEFPVWLPDIVHTMNASKIWQEYIDPKSPNMRSRFSYMAVMRPAFCHIFPQHDRILSLDVDTMVRTDVSGLWDIDLDGYYIAGCSEPHHNRDGVVSVNAGVIMYNLEMMRDGRADIVLDCLNVHRLEFVDQDALTCLCQGRILELDKRYNGTKWCGVEGDEECFIKHFAGIKDWYGNEEAVRWYRAPWSAVLQRHEETVLRNSRK